jgi:hypothetical protein
MLRWASATSIASRCLYLATTPGLGQALPEVEGNEFHKLVRPYGKKEETHPRPRWQRGHLLGTHPH